MVTPKGEPSVEISSTFDMIINVWTLKEKHISWHLSRKKNLKYGKNFFTSFSRLLKQKCNKRFLFKLEYQKSPFEHINMKMKIAKPCCHLQIHNYKGWRQKGGGIWQCPPLNSFHFSPILLICLTSSLFILLSSPDHFILNNSNQAFVLSFLKSHLIFFFSFSNYIRLL